MLAKKRIQEKNKRFTMLIEDVRAMRDVFRDEITAIQREYDSEIKRIHSNYKPGSDAEITAIQSAQNSFDERKENAKNEARKLFDKSITEIEIMNNAEVQAISTNTIEKLAPLLNVPISKTEFEQLCEGFSGSFWADKMLLAIAEKNGIEGDFPVSASMDDRKEILDTIRDGFDRLIDTYPGDDRAKIDDKMILADSVLFNLENQYTKGISLYSDDEKAARIVSKTLHQPNLLDRQLTLATELKNCPIDIQKRVICKMVDAGVDESVYRFIGDATYIKDIGKGEKELLNDAKNKISEVCALDGTPGAKAGKILLEAKRNENPYYSSEIENLSRVNSAVASVRDVIASAKRTDARNGNSKEIDSLMDSAKKAEISAEMGKAKK